MSFLRASSTPPPVVDPPRHPAERGSAYLVALIVLVLLTIIGLSLSLITQTEMQIGANEKLIERSFYVADSGISLATARTLVTRRPAWSELQKLDDPGNPLMEHRIDVSPFYPIGSSPCNLCDINDSGQYGAKNYQRANHAVTSTAIRQVKGQDHTRFAEQTITAMVEFQPWELTPSSLLAAEDQSQLEKIKF